MKSPDRIIAAIACILCLGAVAAESSAEDASNIIQQSSCCFENPRFTGTCEVTPGEDESCGSILGYLNSPNSVGKMYCGNTKVRGGWTQVSCEGAANTAAPTSCQDSDTRE
jgi:hypothetical protein